MRRKSTALAKNPRRRLKRMRKGTKKTVSLKRWYPYAVVDARGKVLAVAKLMKTAKQKLKAVREKYPRRKITLMKVPKTKTTVSAKKKTRKKVGRPKKKTTAKRKTGTRKKKTSLAKRKIKTGAKVTRLRLKRWVPYVIVAGKSRRVVARFRSKEAGQKKLKALRKKGRAKYTLVKVAKPAAKTAKKKTAKRGKKKKTGAAKLPGVTMKMKIWFPYVILDGNKRIIYRSRKLTNARKKLKLLKAASPGKKFKLYKNKKAKKAA